MNKGMEEREKETFFTRQWIQATRANFACRFRSRSPSMESITTEGSSGEAPTFIVVNMTQNCLVSNEGCLDWIRFHVLYLLVFIFLSLPLFHGGRLVDRIISIS